MQQFTQKYAIIQLFEDTPVGAQFSAGNWPLHSTIADTFAIDWNVSTMTAKLCGLLATHASVRTVVGDDRFFGDQGQIQVALLEKTDDLAKLHNDVIGLLEQGGWRPNDPQFAKEGFLPHSTVQPHGRFNEGDIAIFDALSIVDFFPNEDPYQRKILATIKMSQK